FAIDPDIDALIVIENFHSCPRRCIYTFEWNDLRKLLRPLSRVLPDIFVQFSVYFDIISTQFGDMIDPFIGIFKSNHLFSLVLSTGKKIRKSENNYVEISHHVFFLYMGILRTAQKYKI